MSFPSILLSFHGITFINAGISHIIKFSFYDPKLMIYFSRWLVETAEKAGHKIRDNITTNRNKKNIGTLSASHTVSIKDLASLAKSIVTGDPPQPVPETFKQLLQDVISQRKEASAFYKTRSKEGDVATSNEGHMYYVKVCCGLLFSFNNHVFIPTTLNSHNHSECPSPFSIIKAT